MCRCCMYVKGILRQGKNVSAGNYIEGLISEGVGQVLSAAEAGQFLNC